MNRGEALQRLDCRDWCGCLEPKDKEETAQWLGAPGTIQTILEACIGKVSSIKGQMLMIHHCTMYEGTFEQAWAVMSTATVSIWIAGSVGLDE